MLISSKEKITTIVYPQSIRNQVRRELIEREILDAQEDCMLCFLAEDLDGMVYFYLVQNNWEKVLVEYDRIMDK